MLHVEIEDNGLTQRLVGIQEASSRIPQERFEDIGQILLESLVKQYAAGGKPPWPVSRAAAEEGRTTLTKSGALAQSGKISSVSDHHVEVSYGEGLGRYPIYVHLGTRDRKLSPKALRYLWASGIFKETGVPRSDGLPPGWVKGLPKREVHFLDQDVLRIGEILAGHVWGGIETFSTAVA